MLVNRPDLLVTISGLGIRVAIMAESEVTTDIPEHSDLNDVFPETNWDTRARGLGATLARPAISGAEENILCYSDDVYRNEDILVHEFAHTVLQMGIERQQGGREFRNRLEAAYREALDAGLWKETYAGENPDEYWAEGVQSWFGLNDPPGPIHNDVNTRAELEDYDPVLASLIHEVFGDVIITVSCHLTGDVENEFRIQGVLVGPDSQPLEDIGIWAWQGERADSGFGRTNSRGSFVIRVPNGQFTLDIYTGPGCSFVGWYDGTSVTAERSEAVLVTVDDASVGGINIKLPAHPDDLPYIEWCS